MEINRGMRAWPLATRETGPSECLHSISETSLLMWLYRASPGTCSLTTSRQHWRRNRAWAAALTHNNCCNIRGCSVFYWQSLWFLNVRQDALFKCLHVATTKKNSSWNVHNVCWWSCLVLCGHIMWGRWSLYLVDMCSGGLVLMLGHSGIWDYRDFLGLASLIGPERTFLSNNKPP